MNVLLVGDIVGRAGRRVLKVQLPRLRDELALDLVLVNAENAAGGFGLTRDIMEELFDLEVDVLTSGNHIFDKRETLDFIGEERRLLRPHNFPESVPGSGLVVTETAGGTPVAVLNLLGNVFMHPGLDSPFACVGEALAGIPEDVRVIIVDFHAETTSEKQAMGWHLDGRVSAVLGSHTHVPTADERILPKGTAYITDVGMTGSYDSVIGTKKELVLARFLTRLPNRFEAATGPASLSGAMVTIDAGSGRATAIRRVWVDES